MLFIRARFSDQEADREPIDLATLKEGQESCEAFWHENSYGKVIPVHNLYRHHNPAQSRQPLSRNHERWSVKSTNLGRPFRRVPLPLAKAAGQGKGQDWDAANYDFCTMITATGDEGHGPMPVLLTVGGRHSLPHRRCSGPCWNRDRFPRIRA